jgi:hypothetical protein
MSTFYALRYLDTVPLRDRRHSETVGRFEDFDTAETARNGRRLGDLLEVVEREVPAPKVVPE